MRNGVGHDVLQEAEAAHREEKIESAKDTLEATAWEDAKDYLEASANCRGKALKGNDKGYTPYADKPE